MTNQNDKEKVFERTITGLGVVAFAAVLLVSATDLNPLILWAVS